MSTKQIVITVVIALVIIIGYFVASNPATAPVDEIVVPGDSSSVPADQTSDSPEVLLNDVEGIDLGNIDLEFNAIDTDLNSL